MYIQYIYYMYIYLLSWHLKSHQPIIVVLFWIDKRREQLRHGTPWACTCGKTFAAHLGRAMSHFFHVWEKLFASFPAWFRVGLLIPRLLFVNRTRSSSWFKLYNPFILYNIYIFFLFSFCIFSFFTFIIYLYLDVSIHRGNTCYGSQTPIVTTITPCIPVNNRTVRTHTRDKRRHVYFA